VGQFLRNWINPLLMRHNCALMIVHHTGKPSSDPRSRSQWRGSDWAYLGTGSAELANWARAVVTLQELEEGQYEFRCAKRWQDSGLRGPTAEEAPMIKLQHSKSGICWSYAEPEERAPAEAAALDDAAFATYLSSIWAARTEIVQAMRVHDGTSQTVARALILGVVNRHGLGELTREDGEKACGPFVAQVATRGGGLQFRLATGK